MPDGWYQAFSRPSREGVPSDDEIEISGCIVCSALDVEVEFPHRHVEGRRVAAPARVGLCGTCVQLIKAGSSRISCNAPTRSVGATSTGQTFSTTLGISDET